MVQEFGFSRVAQDENRCDHASSCGKFLLFPLIIQTTKKEGYNEKNSLFFNGITLGYGFMVRSTLGRSNHGPD